MLIEGLNAKFFPFSGFRAFFPLLLILTTNDFSLQISEILEAASYSGVHRGAAYGTDASTYSEAGIPSIVLGPGSIDQAHTKDEWLEVVELEKAVIIYGDIMKHGFR